MAGLPKVERTGLVRAKGILMRAAPVLSPPTALTGWHHLQMAPIVDSAALPNEEGLEPREFCFPLVLDLSGSLLDEEGLRGLHRLFRRAQERRSPLRLRLRLGSQACRTLLQKGYQPETFATVEPLSPLPGGVVEWDLQFSATSAGMVPPGHAG